MVIVVMVLMTVDSSGEGAGQERDGIREDSDGSCYRLEICVLWVWVLSLCCVLWIDCNQFKSWRSKVGKLFV